MNTPPTNFEPLPECTGSGPSGFGWVTRGNPRWEDWGAWSSRILVMTHSDGPMVVYVPENGLPEYEHQDELADPDEWSAWSEIPRVQNIKDQATRQGHAANTQHVE